MSQAVGTNDISKKTWSASEKSLWLYFQIQLFITSLQDQIWEELMKSTYVNFWAALDLEVIQKDNKPVKLVTVAAVTSDVQPQPRGTRGHQCCLSQEGQGTYPHC